MKIEDFILELKKLDIDVTEDKLNKLSIYYNFLIEYNSHTNLTAITEKEEVYLTQDEYDKLKKGTFPDMKDMIPGRIYHKFIVDNNFYCVKLKDANGEIYVGVFDIGDWSKYFQRAINHPKSCTKKRILTDLFD